MFALSTTLLGFILEVVILCGLIFDLYKWWLFIAMTNDENNEDLKYNEHIENSTKKHSEIDLKKLQFKIKVYYIFIILTSLMLLGAITLTIGFISTVIPDEYEWNTPEYNAAKMINDAWITAFTNFVNISYISFLIAYISTLVLLRIRLMKFFPDFYMSQKKQIFISSSCLIISLGIKILMRLQKIIIP